MIDMYNIAVHHSANGEPHVALTCSVCNRVIAQSTGWLLPDLIEEARAHLQVRHGGDS